MASILAAFPLDAWWDGRNERVEEREALVALRTEFGEARDRVERYRGYQGRILRAAASATDSVEASLLRGAAATVVPDTALGLLYIPPTTSLSLGTLNSLLASGRLGIIRDRALRTALASWGASLEELNEEEEDLRDLAYGEMDAQLRAVMNTNGIWQSGNDLFDGTLTEAELRASRAVPATTGVLGVLHLRRSILTHGIEEFDVLLSEIEEIVALIDRSLAG